MRILICEDHPLYRDTLHEIILQSHENCEVFSVSTYDELLQLIETTEVDILILDINIDGMNTLQKIQEINKKSIASLKIIVLTSYDLYSFKLEAYNLGVYAYLNKNIQKEELNNVIKKVASGHKIFEEQLNDKLYEDEPQEKNLTTREKEIIKLLSKGYTNQKISEELFISLLTVQTHRKRIKSKLGAKSTADIVNYYFTMGGF